MLLHYTHRRQQREAQQAFVSAAFVAHLARLVLHACFRLCASVFVGWCGVSHVRFPSVGDLAGIFRPAVMPQWHARSWYEAAIARSGLHAQACCVRGDDMVKLRNIDARRDSLPSTVVQAIKKMAGRETSLANTGPLIAVVANHMLACRFTLISSKPVSVIAS